MNDNVLNQFRTTLYELKDNILRLELNENETSRSDFDQFNNLYGNWLLVNENFVKLENKSLKDQSKYCFKSILCVRMLVLTKAIVILFQT